MISRKQLKARIIGLWGDPGLTEYFHYDLLSRFLIVQTEPFDQPAHVGNYSRRIKLVLRPKSLWITADKNNGETRRDVFGNTNGQNTIGSSQNTSSKSNNGLARAEYTFENIQPISPSYKLGDLIDITEIPRPIEFKPNLGRTVESNNSDSYEGVKIFETDDPRQVDFTTNLGSITPDPSLSPVRTDRFGNQINGYGKVVDPALNSPPQPPPQPPSLIPSAKFGSMSLTYKNLTPVYPYLNLPSYLFYHTDDKKPFICYFNGRTRPSLVPSGMVYFLAFLEILKIIDPTYPLLDKTKNPDPFSACQKILVPRLETTAAFGRKNGLYWDMEQFTSVRYMDMNTNGRSRSDSGGCIPSVIVSPSTFPTPVSRNLGGVNIRI